MHADVFPLPTAPTTMTPVYSPRCGMVSQDGSGARPAVVSKCVSPSTSIGAWRSSGGTYAGKGRERTLAGYRYATMVTIDVSREVAKNGVVNQSVAYPYTSTRKTAGLRSSINCRYTFAVSTG